MTSRPAWRRFGSGAHQLSLVVARVTRFVRDSGARIPRQVGRTIDEEAVETKIGIPYVAILIVGEVVRVAARKVRLALWAANHTTGNLRCTRIGTLIVVAPPETYYLGLRARPRLPILVERSEPAVFEGSFVQVHLDRVDYAEVMSGIRFSLNDPDRTSTHQDGSRPCLRASGIRVARWPGG